LYSKDEFVLETEMSEKIFECSRDIMLVIAPYNGKILKVNKEALKAYGYSLDELLNMTIFQIRGISSDEIVGLQMDKASVEGIIFEAKHYRKDGSFFWVEVSSINIGSKEVVLLSTIRNITERKEREEELKHNYNEMEILKDKAELANEAKIQFLSNMSHEIRTPLNGINGMIQLLEMTSSTEEQKEYIDMLNQSSEHLIHVINDILDIAKIEAGKIQLSNEPFNLKNNMERLIKMYALEGYKKGIEVRLYYDPFLDQEFMGDVVRLNQILVNLLGNAVKFTEAGSVSINVKKIDEFENKIKLKLSVADTGIGINIDLKDKLFKLFNQGDSSFTKKYGGTGLGLAISKELVTMMNGDIWYDSQVSKGTTFYFTMELEKQEKSYQIQMDNNLDLEVLKYKIQKLI
jgi:PAS domain S-box-containing protein